MAWRDRLRRRAAGPDPADRSRRTERTATGDVSGDGPDRSVSGAPGPSVSSAPAPSVPGDWDGGWRRTAPPELTVARAPLGVSDGLAFRARLAAWQNPSFDAGLGHALLPTAPTGLVRGVTTPPLRSPPAAAGARCCSGRCARRGWRPAREAARRVPLPRTAGSWTQGPWRRGPWTAGPGCRSRGRRTSRAGRVRGCGSPARRRPPRKSPPRAPVRSRRRLTPEAATALRRRGVREKCRGPVASHRRSRPPRSSRQVPLSNGPQSREQVRW